MPFGDTLALNFRVTADAKQAQREFDNARKAAKEAADTVQRDLTAGFKAASAGGAGFFGVLTNLRIGLTQIARGDLGGIPNIAKAFTLATGGGGKFVATLGLLDAALVKSGNLTTTAANIFDGFINTMKIGASQTGPQARIIQLAFETMGLNLTQSLQEPEKAFTTLLRGLGSVEADSTKALAAADALGIGLKDVEVAAAAAGKAMGPASAGIGALGIAAIGAAAVIVAAIIAVAVEIAIVVKLTSGMIDTVKQVGTTSRETFDKFKTIVESAGGTVTQLDRALSVTLLKSMDMVKGATERMFLTLLEVSGPALIVLLREVADLLKNLGPIAGFVGEVLRINFILAAAAIMTLRDSIVQLKIAIATQDVAGLVQGVTADFLRNVDEIKAKMKDLTLDVPEFKDKQKKAKEASDQRLKLLEIEGRAAKRIFDEETAAANDAFKDRLITGETLSIRLIAAEEKLFATKKRIFEEEKKLIQTAKDLPEAERLAKLADISEKELQLLSDTNEKIRGFQRDAAENRQEEIDDTVRWAEEIAKAREELAKQLLELELDRRAVQLEIDRIRLAERARSPLASKKGIFEEQLRIEVESENLRADAALRRLEAEENELNRQKLTDDEELGRALRFHFAKEKELERHRARIDQITTGIQQAQDRAEHPFSLKNILGEDFSAAIDAGATKLEAFKAGIAGVADTLAAQTKSIQTILAESIGNLAKGVGAIVQQYVLLGSTGPAALKKVLAAVLATVAAEAAVQAIMALAYGFLYLALGKFDSAAEAFTAAAFFAAVSGVTGLIGRKVAGDSFQQQGAGNQQPSNVPPPDVVVNRGPGDQLGVGAGGRDIGPVDVFARLTRSVERLEEKISSMPAHEVVTVGAARASNAIGEAVVSEARRSTNFTNDFGRLLLGPV